MILSFGSNGFNSLNPIERIAISMSSSSDAPSDHFCFRRKYLPASTRHFLGSMPTTSDPVTRRPTFAGRFVTGIKRGMQRRFLEVGQVHRNLRHAVFLDIPPNGFHVLQHSGNTDRFALGIEHLLSLRRAVVRLNSAIFSHVEGDRGRPSHRPGVQVHIVGDQKFPRANHGRA